MTRTPAEIYNWVEFPLFYESVGNIHMFFCFYNLIVFCKSQKGLEHLYIIESRHALYNVCLLRIGMYSIFMNYVTLVLYIVHEKVTLVFFYFKFKVFNSFKNLLSMLAMLACESTDNKDVIQVSVCEADFEQHSIHDLLKGLRWKLAFESYPLKQLDSLVCIPANKFRSFPPQRRCVDMRYLNQPLSDSVSRWDRLIPSRVGKPYIVIIFQSHIQSPKNLHRYGFCCSFT